MNETKRITSMNLTEYTKAIMQQKRIEREIMENGTQEEKNVLAATKRECEENVGSCVILGGRRAKR